MAKVQDTTVKAFVGLPIENLMFLFINTKRISQ